MGKKQVEEAYSKSKIDATLVDSTTENMKCFLKRPFYREEFEVFSHSLKIKQDFILKHEENGKARIATSDNEIRIEDIFIKEEFQGKKILSKIVKYLKEEVYKHETQKYITLISLPSGIIAWYKMGFDFKNKLDKISIENTLTKVLKRKVFLEELTKQELEQNNCYSALTNGVKMFMRVQE